MVSKIKFYLVILLSMVLFLGGCGFTPQPPENGQGNVIATPQPTESEQIRDDDTLISMVIKHDSFFDERFWMDFNITHFLQLSSDGMLTTTFAYVNYLKTRPLNTDGGNLDYTVHADFALDALDIVKESKSVELTSEQFEELSYFINKITDDEWREFPLNTRHIVSERYFDVIYDGKVYPFHYYDIAFLYDYGDILSEEEELLTFLAENIHITASLHMQKLMAKLIEYSPIEINVSYNQPLFQNYNPN